MAKPKIKPEIGTEKVVSVSPHWNVVVLNDPVNYQDYVVIVLTNVLGISHTQAKKYMLKVHNEGRAIVWTGKLERAEMIVLELQQWHLSAQLEKNG